MAEKLYETLKTIERYRTTNPHYVDLLDILEEIVILRETYKKEKEYKVFSVDEELIPRKLKGGFPIVDLARGIVDLTGPESYFRSLLSIAETRIPAETEMLRQNLDEGTLLFEDMIGDVTSGLSLLEEEERDDSADVPAAEMEMEAEESDEAFDLIELFLEESLRPDLERIAEKYTAAVAEAGWSEGYCPICGREPKIGEIKENEEERFLFCHQCGFEWSFRRIKCPFCGNEEQHSLAFFTVEEDERYHVDVCNECKRYIKIIDFREENQKANMDVEDIATLHLDILASEEGYN
ncbi:MAG: formate dehydrogenase accessory protein FdhE [Syntrophobacterales bacterium]|nr:formate dehydrogenase accessory protein FdhE [Syntrophobacterales bacterium]